MDVMTAYDAVGRVILYNILMEFGIPPQYLPEEEEVQLIKEKFGVPMDLAGLIKVYLKFKPIVVLVCKHFV
jgi:hypothetical protein